MHYRRLMIHHILSVSLLALYLSGCTVSDKPETEVTPEPTETFEQTNFSVLQGWNQSQASGLRQSLVESCKVYKKRKGTIKADNPLFGRYEQWHPLCDKLNTLPKAKLQAFFENNFYLYQVAPNHSGLFTGYYIPHIKGTRTASKQYNTPVLKMPTDLIQMNPENFGLKGSEKKGAIQGKVENGWLVPYDDRKNINKRIERKEYQQDVSLFLEDKVERFFLQIQGSGIVELANGNTVHLAYGGRNGHDYYPIGRYLQNNKKVKNTTMQGIKAWLREHPKQQDAILNKNKLFIFFKESPDKTVRGAQNTALIPEHSVAVDTQYIPLGTPLFIDTTLSTEKKALRRAVTAQDVGSAIKGAVRADIFFGTGEQAGQLAGGQYAGGKMYAFVPK